METSHRDPEAEAPPGREPGGGGAEEAHSGEAARGEPSADAGRAPPAEPRGIPLAALPARDLLVWFLGLLAAKAWEGMGLIPDAATGKIRKNLGDARIVIDGYAAILEAMRERLTEAQRRENRDGFDHAAAQFRRKERGRGTGQRRAGSLRAARLST